MDLFSLSATIGLDTKAFDEGLDKSESRFSGFAAKVGSGLATAAKVGAAAMAAIGTASAAVVNGAAEVASYGDNIDKMSQKLGISAETYQEWDAVLQHSGTSISSLGTGMKTLATKAQNGSDAFKQLGIAQADAMSREDLFNATVTALQNVTDENERSALAMELFGKSAMELVPLLNTSAEDTQAMKDRVHELGGVMSNEAVKASAAFQDNLQDMQTALDGTKRSIMQEFLPGLSDLMQGLSSVFSGGDGGDAIYNGIYEIIEGADNAIDKIVDIGQKVLPRLVDAIMEGLPLLTDGITRLVLMIGQTIIENLPTLLSAGLEIIVALANSIADSLPELIPTIVEVILEIVAILTDPANLAALIDAALQIMLALSEGLINAIPKLIEAAPTIIANLVTALLNLGPQLLSAGFSLIGSFVEGILDSIGSVISAVGQIGTAISDALGGVADSALSWGRDLIQNFIDGIGQMWSSLKQKVSDVGSLIKSFLGFSEPEEGPLSNFHTYAPDMMKLFAEGITDNESVITDAIEGAFDLSPTISQSVGAGSSGEYTVARSGDTSKNYVFNFLLDGAQVARVLVPYLSDETQRVGVSLVTV